MDSVGYYALESSQKEIWSVSAFLKLRIYLPSHLCLCAYLFSISNVFPREEVLIHCVCLPFFL